MARPVINCERGGWEEKRGRDKSKVIETKLSSHCLENKVKALQILDPNQFLVFLEIIRPILSTKIV